MQYRMNYSQPDFGAMTLASDGENILGLWLEGQKYFGGTVSEPLEDAPDLKIFAAAKSWLDAYFAGKKPSPTELALAPRGGEFRQRVWQKLVEIPYGAVRTYGDIGREVAADQGKSTFSAQAVGQAVGHNPISIIIPCHRVVGAGGSLTGYAGGISRKLWLLRHEGAPTEDLFVPTRGTAL